MAQYGLRTWDADGNLQCDVDHNLARLVYSVILTAGDSDNIVLPEIDGKSTVQIATPLERVFYLGQNQGHYVTRVGNTITWTAYNDGDASAQVTSLLTVFMYT